MRYWLMKSEPDAFSLDDLRNRPDQTEGWDGIRNYQARNFMRDDMKKGDKVLFYHSRVKEPGVVGLAEIVSDEAYADPKQFDPKSKYYDAKAEHDNPRWLQVDLRFIEAFEHPVTLTAMKADPKLEGMLVTKRGQRLSIQPVDKKHFDHVVKMARKGGS